MVLTVLYNKFVYKAQIFSQNYDKYFSYLSVRTVFVPSPSSVVTDLLLLCNWGTQLNKYLKTINYFKVKYKNYFFSWLTENFSFIHFSSMTVLGRSLIKQPIKALLKLQSLHYHVAQSTKYISLYFQFIWSSTKSIYFPCKKLIDYVS